MAHQIDTMAYKGQTPWHGLGNALEPNTPLDDWIIQAGMNWRVESSPVRFTTGGTSFLGEIHAYEDQKVLYRSDNQQALSVVGKNFKVVQPQEILEFYRDLTEQSGFELETAGSLKGGRKLWALARTGQSAALRGNDVTNGYVLLATACDGSMATTAQFTSVRVVCNNTLQIATSESTGAVKISHRSQFNAAAVKRSLGINISAWEDFMYQMKTLSHRKVSHTETKNFLLRVMTADNTTAHVAKSHEKHMDKALKLFEGNGMGSRYESSKGTAYGLLNAVTQYVDHDKRARSSDNRLDSAWFGDGAKMKQRALEEAIKMAA